MKFIYQICAMAVLITPLIAADLPVTETDVLNHRITLSEFPRRIVSLAPSNTELVYAVGAGDQLVGVTTYCDYPPEASGITRVGGFSITSLEKIVSLRPDLVLAARLNPLEVLESLCQLDVPVFILAPGSLEETFLTIRLVGRLTGKTAGLDSLESELKERIQAVEESVRSIPHQDRPRILWGLLQAPMYTAGGGSFIDDLIGLAGGVNIASDSGEGWPQIGLETIVAKNPEVIITSVSTEEVAAELARLQVTDGWKEVDAIIQSRVYYIDSNLLQRPGPRLVDGLEQLVKVIHPGRFGQ